MMQASVSLSTFYYSLSYIYSLTVYKSHEKVDGKGVDIEINNHNDARLLFHLVNKCYIDNMYGLKFKTVDKISMR